MPAGSRASRSPTNRGRCGFWVDYDNDGKLDLFVKNQFGVNVLYHNNGDSTFTIVANAGGLATATLGTDPGDHLLVRGLR